METIATTTATTLKATAASTGDETALPSSLERMPSPAVGDAVMVTVVAGLVVMVVLWLCGRRCRRGSELPRRVVSGVGKEALYEFLADPHCMTVVHPLTFAVRMEGKAEEGGSGTTTKRYVLVEKVPFTVESEAVMRCDPSTHTIVTDFKPVGGLFTVQVTWRCSDVTDDKLCDTCNTAPDSRKEEGADSTCASHLQTTAHPQPRVTAAPQEAEQSGTDSTEDDHGPCTGNRISASGQGTSSAVFENHVMVIGPRAVAILVAQRVENLQMQLTDNLQQHFLKREPADE